MLAVGAYAAARGQHAAPHRHAGWKVTYYRTGRIDSIVDGVRYAARPGTVLVLRPNASHEELAHTAYSNYYLLLDAPGDQPWPDECAGQAAQELGNHLAGLVREDTRPDRRSPELIKALVTCVDLTLQRQHPDQRPEPAEELVRGVEQLFEERYAERISIAATAREAGVSPSGLRQHFVARRGQPPQAALQAVRVRRALDLLRTSDLTLPVIADRCGFASASHLSRVIKSETGSSPGRLRGFDPGRTTFRSGHSRESGKGPWWPAE